MQPTEVSALAAHLTDRFGLPLEGTQYGTTAGDVIELRPLEVHPNDGFLLRITFGWRSLTAEMIPGAFARDLVRAMGEADSGSRSGFAAIACAVRKERGSVRMTINGQQWDPEQHDTWPSGWNQLGISLQSPPLAADDSSSGMVHSARYWAGRLLGMVLSLAAVGEDQADDPEAAVRGLPEGARIRVEVNRYERSRSNRAICIEVHGSSCMVCGIDFGRIYGELGEGFIHVHHITPVSRLTPDYSVNPVRDLIPVCPNCHAMIHRTDPPLPPEAVRARLSHAAASTASS